MMSATETIDPCRVIADAAGPWNRDEKRPVWLGRAAREIGLPIGVVRAIWYGRRKRLIDREFLLLQASAATIHERRQRLEALHAEIRQARSRVDADDGGGSYQRGSDMD